MGPTSLFVEQSGFAVCLISIRNNGNQYLINLYLCMIYTVHSLLFDENLIVNEAQVPPTGLLCEV